MGRGTRPPRKPRALGGDKLIIAVDDMVFDDYTSSRRSREFGADDDVEVVRASSLADPNTQADFWFGKYEPTTPACQQIATFMHLGRPCLFEQDRSTGAVYRDGALVWPNAPLAVTNMAGGTELRPLTDAALLFSQGEQVRITTVPDCLIVVRQLRQRPLAPSEALLPDWIDRARRMLSGGAPLPRGN